MPAASSDPLCWLRADWIRRARWLAASYRQWLGRDLIVEDGDPTVQAERLFHAPFVVVAHGTEADPLLNYANARAGEVWECTPEELIGVPSRLTAEPAHREERARLLARTAEAGYVDDYRGIRISRKGRRFRIERAVVWNVVDDDGRPAGQAATFAEWFWLP